MEKPTTTKPMFLCKHCGTKFTAQLKDYVCSSCNTPEKRAKMDKENTEIFSARGLKFFCNYCAVNK